MISLLVGGGRPVRSVLALAAHPDDLEIGCGGTLLKLAELVPDVRVDIVLLTGSDERFAEAERAAELFLPGCAVTLHRGHLHDGFVPTQWGEAKRLLEDVAQRCRPDLVFAPRTDDAHQDHRLLAELAPTVWRDHLILGYEIPKWDGDVAPASVFVPLTDDEAHDKVERLTKAYPSQTGRDWWDDELFLGVARLRGVQCRARYAEAFTASKLVLSLPGSA